jgi:SAM-dependent methyltransferase
MPRLYEKLLGHPFVYEQVRPRVVGGIDMRPLYDLLPREARARVLDVGCGMGDALRYLSGFDRYLGIDTDEVAIRAARTRWGNASGVHFECRHLEPSDVTAEAPTGVVLAGVLHHLSNDEAVSVLRLAASSPDLVQVVTSDIVFVPGMLFNNVMAMMDRGRFCRDPDAYAALARRAGFRIRHAAQVSSSKTSNRVRYHLMALSPSPSARVNA